MKVLTVPLTVSVKDHRWYRKHEELFEMISVSNTKILEQIKTPSFLSENLSLLLYVEMCSMCYLL